MASAIEVVGADVHLAHLDLNPGDMDLIENGQCAFTIDQHQRFRGKMSVIVLRLCETAIICITPTEIHSRLAGDRFMFLALDKVIGAGTSDQIGNGEMHRLTAGGAEMGDPEHELAQI